MYEWKPADDFEQQLFEAVSTDDVRTSMILLRQADFALPVSAAVAAGTEAPAWPTMEVDNQTWLVAYTSISSMEVATEGRFRHCQVSSLVELAAHWPDPRWGLAVNAGLPVHVALESGTVARLAVPTLADDKVAYPETWPPIMQKLLTSRDLDELLSRRELRVSGYVHQLDDVAHIATPRVLIAALGEAEREDELLTDDESVAILRWRAIGAELYQTPYGGTDEETMTAVAGWVIEEPPFIGLGLGRNVDEVIREYKISGVGLPHGSEIWELGADGQEVRRAVLDGDRDVWMLIVRRGEEGGVGDSDEAGELDEAGAGGAEPEPFDEWVAGIDARLAHLAEVQVREDFSVDFSASSLDRLESFIIQRYGGAPAITAEDERFVEAVASYVGETFLRAGGGHWSLEDTPDGPQPVVVLDERLAVAPLAPILLLIEAIGGGGGAVVRSFNDIQERVAALRSVDPSWVPRKQELR